MDFILLNSFLFYLNLFFIFYFLFFLKKKKRKKEKNNSLYIVNIFNNYYNFNYSED